MKTTTEMNPMAKTNISTDLLMIANTGATSSTKSLIGLSIT